MSDRLTRIAVLDDHLIILEGLNRLLDGSTTYSIVASFTLAQDLLGFLKHNHVDILLLDISLPDINGIDLCLQIKQLYPNIAVIALSNHSERSMILRMLDNGANGYLLKNIDFQELKMALDEAVAGRPAFSKSVQEIISRPTLNESLAFPKLTKREKEILLLIAQGDTTAAIAETLFLSPLTIETHRKRIMHKFQAKNMTALIKTVTEHNLI